MMYVLGKGKMLLENKSENQYQNFEIAIKHRGDISSLTFIESRREALDLDEVEIKVIYAGLNFKDVLQALNVLDDISFNGLGFECVGKIVRTGEQVKDFKKNDHVIAFTSPSIKKYVTVGSKKIFLVPKNTSLKEVATIPIAFLSAYYALKIVARLRKNERVLIHAATGGVGLAAIQIAQQTGATIFATAGNNEKREYLKSLGVKNIMDSRSLNFYDEINALTNKTGLDVVLNSLSGEFFNKSISLLRNNGRFIELGKSKLSLGLNENIILKKGLLFSALNVSAELPGFRKIFEDILTLFEQKKLIPLPYKIFELGNTIDAFQYFSQAKHIGKLLLSINNSKPVLHKRKEKRLLPDEAISIFKKIIQFPQPQIIVCANDLEKRMHGKKQDIKLSAKQMQSSSHLLHERPRLPNKYKRPKTQIEKKIVSVWEKLFAIRQVGITDDFFAIGGNSLLAIQMVSLLKKELNINVQAHQVLENSTIEKLCQTITLK